MDATELRLRVFEKVYDPGTARIEGPEGLTKRLDAALAWVTTDQPAPALPAAPTATQGVRPVPAPARAAARS